MGDTPLRDAWCVLKPAGRGVRPAAVSLLDRHRNGQLKRLARLRGAVAEPERIEALVCLGTAVVRKPFRDRVVRAPPRSADGGEIVTAAGLEVPHDGGEDVFRARRDVLVVFLDV